MRGTETVRVVQMRVLYDCEELCGRTATHPGNMKARAACRCSLPGFDVSTWDPSACPDAAAESERLAAELSGHALARRVTVCGAPLDFDLDRDGCPRGWMLARFPNTVLSYAGTRGTDSPVRSQNMRLLGRVLRDPEPPTRLLEWVDYAEALEDGAFSFFHEVATRQ